MNKVMLSIATILLFTLAAFSQTNTTDPSAAQDTQSTSPSMQETPQSNSGTMGNSGNTNTEKKIKGCVAQQNGQYVLETKHGKAIPLSGADVSAHVGHTVALHGMWASSAGSATSAGSSASAGQSFDVTKIDMISESCSTKGNMSGSGSPTPQQ